MSHRSRKVRVGKLSREERREQNNRRRELAQFCKERDLALASLDRALIASFWYKWKLAVPEAILKSDALFWVHVHRQIVKASSMPLVLRRASKAWLEENGLKVDKKGR